VAQSASCPHAKFWRAVVFPLAYKLNTPLAAPVTVLISANGPVADAKATVAGVSAPRVTASPAPEATVSKPAANEASPVLWEVDSNDFAN